MNWRTGRLRYAVLYQNARPQQITNTKYYALVLFPTIALVFIIIVNRPDFSKKAPIFFWVWDFLIFTGDLHVLFILALDVLIWKKLNVFAYW